MARFKPRRQRGPFSFRTVFLISLTIFLVMSIQTFVYIERHLEPALKEIAQMRIKQLAVDAINEAVSKKIAESVDFRQLLEINEDQYGKIRGVHFNYNAQTRITGEVAKRVAEIMKDIERSQISVPLGQVLNSNILASIGPDIPITMVPYGAPLVTLSSLLQESGVNNVLVTIYVDIAVEVKVVIPFTTDSAVVRAAVPLTQIMVVGDVPYFYWDGRGNPMNDPDQDFSGQLPVVPPFQVPPLQEERNPGQLPVVPPFEIPPSPEE